MCLWLSLTPGSVGRVLRFQILAASFSSQVGVMPQRGGGVQSPSQPTSATRRVQQGSGQVLGRPLSRAEREARREAEME